MPYVPRRRTTRKKPAYRSKRKSYVKRRPARKPRSMNAGDTTISVINPGKDKIVKVCKSLPLNQPYVLGGVTKGVNFNFSTTAVNWGQVMTFDPSGTQGNNAGTVALTSSTLSPAALSEWVAYKVLYTEYRVKKIHLKFLASTTLGNALDTNPLTMYIRYQNEWIANPGTPSQVTLGTLAEMRSVVRKTFTTQNPDFHYSFYPKVAKLIDAGGTGASADTRALKAMPFVSVNTPVDIWGVQIYVNWPGSATGSAVLLQCDVSYELEFRTQS